MWLRACNRCALAAILVLAVLEQVPAPLSRIYDDGNTARPSPELSLQSRGSTLSRPLRLAFIDSVEPAGRAALSQHAADLDGLIGEWLTVNDDGTLTEERDPEQADGNIEATLAVARGFPRLQVLALVSDRGGERRAFARMSDPDFRSELERTLVRSVEKHGFDGLVVNFEDPSGVDEDALRALLAQLRERLGPAKTLAVMVPGDARIDYRALSAAADFILVQLFDAGAAEPRALAPKHWAERVAARSAASIPPEKLIFAIASMARDWVDGQSWAISFNAALRASSLAGVGISFDAASGNPHVQYVDVDGRFHDIWLLDAATVFNQIRMLARAAPRGLALWELGSEDQSVWHLFKKDSTWRLPDPAVLRELRSDYLLDIAGAGEVYRFVSRPVIGRRDLDSDGNEIESETYQILPQSWQIQADGSAHLTAVLTFDDGPEPAYTSRILDILKEAEVPAVFFVTGSNALKHPRLIRRIADEGHELGSHTWSHPDLAKLPERLVSLELNATQRLLQALAGRSVRLFRPPYAMDGQPSTIGEARIIEAASRLGYLFVGSALNPEDWRGISKDEIVRRVVAKARAHAGSVILLHDAGGDRENTVGALPDLIATLRGDGFRFVSISELVGEDDGAVPLSEQDVPWVVAARVGFDTISAWQTIFNVLLWTCIALSFLRFAIVLVFALRDHWSRKSFADETPTVSVIIPAYNEEKVIVRTVSCVAQSDYRGLREIIVIDDGSADRTTAVVEAAFHDDDRVRALRKANAGKSEALNYGIRRTSSEVVVMLDADTLLEPDAVRLMARHFGDPRVGAVAGNAKVGNRVNVLTRLQALEYVMSQNLERAGLAGLDAITVVPGAVGAWRRDVVVNAGGFSPTTLAEDCDLTFGIHRLGYRIEHEMGAIGWTEAPETWPSFMRQRFRWIYGTFQVACRHADTLLAPGHGAWSYFALPSIFLFNVLMPLISPVVDAVLVWALVAAAIDAVLHPATYSTASVTWAAWVYFFVFAIDASIAALAFALEPAERRLLLLYLPLQRVCYRQVLYIVTLRVLLASLIGNAQGWNKLARLGSVVFPADHLPKLGAASS